MNAATSDCCARCGKRIDENWLGWLCVKCEEQEERCQN